MSTWSLFVLAFALSVDGFAAAVAYGLKRIRVPFFSLLIICLCSTAAMALALLAGQGLSSFFPEAWIGKVGGIILICLGLLQLYNSKKVQSQRIEKNCPNNQDTVVKASAFSTATVKEVEKVFSLTVPPFGLVIQVFREPTRADLDSSGELSSQEAFLLGLALSMDALAAGFGASLLGGIPLYAPLIVGMSLFVLVVAGLWWGHKNARWAGGPWISYLAGLVLLSLGASKVFF
ncbi:sporulation membrane protein YtaF [Heliorestis acidaminivorans]|uniref:Sporulation membrane protein YtaF n=1 Tax=Heliorestis acidaminivorans TaxID=553427 RepID=A0A6I0EQZ9_9FIRM|nr:sporulation membrane protein YtaF [Heliorestis acidaminivorans]KAB2951857.1 sporulation membrane protein YtaF [Heliorestis acidaminivorans]